VKSVSESSVRIRPGRSGVRGEIRQGKPFRSRRQEGAIALLRTASVVRRAIGRVIEPHGLSLAQYNALRIVRGAGAEGVATLAIRERMIEEGTTITRLLDKLEEAKLILRERSATDRRQVVCRVTEAGRKLLDKLDPQVDRADEQTMAALSTRQLDTLITLLDTVRATNAERGAAAHQR
jgi:DNA-binding MarR family transcriptional regulator